MKKKKDFHLPKKAFTNNKPKPAIRDDEETEYCRAVKNASHTERKHLARKDLIYASMTTSELLHLNVCTTEALDVKKNPLPLKRRCHTCTSKSERSVRALSAH